MVIWSMAAFLARVLPSDVQVEVILCIVMLLNLVVMLGFTFYSRSKDRHLKHKYDEFKSLRDSADVKEAKDDYLQTKPHMMGEVDLLYIRVVQALNFLNCYGMARIMGSKRFWDGDDYDDDWWIAVVYCLV